MGSFVDTYIFSAKTQHPVPNLFCPIDFFNAGFMAPQDFSWANLVILP